MARIRSSGNQTTELRLLAALRRSGIKGWRRNAAMPGRPDFVWRSEMLAVFVDGCFWHGHRKCSRNLEARRNRKLWKTKVAATKVRDRRAARELRAMGWQVVRIWECKLRRPGAEVRRIARQLAKAPGRPA